MPEKLGCEMIAVEDGLVESGNSFIAFVGHDIGALCDLKRIRVGSEIDEFEIVRGNGHEGARENHAGGSVGRPGI